MNIGIDLGTTNSALAYIAPQPADADFPAIQVLEIPQYVAQGLRVISVPSASSSTGVLATASGLVFFCEDSGAFAAMDGSNGKPLWRFQTNQHWNASPMAYQFDGQQYVSVAAGGSILAFAIGE